MEFNGFLHFSVNTFTNREWGLGSEPESVFNPTDFDADQIVKTAKMAGMKGLILTCKHHDGFCLWNTKTTTHNVMRSPFGKDVVKLVSDACHRAGIRFGVYLSPWDRNNASYGKPEYIELYRSQLRELLTYYGPIFEVWFDGANGGDGYYGGANETRTIDRTTYYDWPNTWAMVRRLQPGAVMFSDVGPDVRWVGNESGFAGDPCWATYTPRGPEAGQEPAPGFTHYEDGLNGTPNGRYWMPAECDVSIRPGWFWHESENSKVKTPSQLKDLYIRSVGRGATLLLNIPPDRRGQINENDVKSLIGFRALIDQAFAKDIARKATVSVIDAKLGKAVHSDRHGAEFLIDGDRRSYWEAKGGSIPVVEFRFGRAVEVNTVRLREPIQLGESIPGFAVSARTDGKMQVVARGTTIGNCRILQFPKVRTDRIEIRFGKPEASVRLSEVGFFLDPNGP